MPVERRPRLPSAYGQIPLSFEVNQGQTNAQVDYLAHGQGYGIFLSKTDAVLSLTNADGGGNAIRMHLVGDNSAAAAIGLDKQSGVSNYLIGDASQWHAGIANYGQVEYQQVYPGIDVVYYGNQQQLEYDFHVAPGADPDAIQLAFEGATGVEVDAQGQLLVHIDLHRPLRRSAPAALGHAGLFLLLGCAAPPNLSEVPARQQAGYASPGPGRAARRRAPGTMTAAQPRRSTLPA